MIKIKRASNGQYYWMLLANNGKVLHTSEMLKQKQSVFKNIESTSKVWQNINSTVGNVGIIEI